MKNKINKYVIIKGMLVVLSILFAIPSIVYFFGNGRIATLSGELEFQYLLNKNINRGIQALVFAIIVTLMVVCYYLVIKHRKKIFKGMKEVYVYILIVSSIFIFVMPFWCSDIYYYMGIGRLAAKHGQNPYYVDIKSYINDNNIDIGSDTVMEAGYKNFWSGTTVVYGAIWSMICTVISFFSFGNLNIGLLIFKMVNILIHIGSCILLYKISKKKIFPLLYGLNPFVLIEGIANVHNDMFVVFFILLAIYMLIKKKNLVLALASLALATDIKYVAILLLPLMVIYHFKDKDIKVRIIKCVEYGVIFVVMAMFPYLLYFKDMEVFKGLVTQQERYAKGLYCYIVIFSKNGLAKNIHEIFKYIFLLMYTYICVRLLICKNISFGKEMKKIYKIMVFFLFFMITNFQPWYFIWLSAFIVWQKSRNIKLIVQLQIITLYANIVFLIFSESYVYVTIYFPIIVIGMCFCYVVNRFKKQIRAIIQGG